ncbi:hypothetical protein [Streptomyces sp. NPDC086519]|uniref:hypothetical protein n=1 Tax=Streptomyces sp. NPDC086519 TaxID=3154863 RepID=UPI0034481056
MTVTYPKRVAIRNTVGVHASRVIPEGDAEFTACGLTVDRRAVDAPPEVEVTCWGCRRELQP